MKVRGLLPLTVFLLAAAGTHGRADDEPRLKDRVVLSPVNINSCDHLEFSRDGRTLFSFGVGDRKVRVWDVAGEKLTASLRQGVNRVAEFATSPDGKLLATVSRGGMVWIWDAHTVKKIRSFSGPEDTVRLLFGPDSETLSAVARGTLYVYRVKDGELLSSRKVNPYPAYDEVRPVACSGPTRRPMLVCDNRLFDARTGAECYRLAGGEFRGGRGAYVAITPDEKKMAEGGQSFIAIWNLTTANENPVRRQRLYLKPPQVVVSCLTFSPNNQVLAVGYVEGDGRGRIGNRRVGGILFFNAASGKLLCNQDARIAGVCSLAFSPDGRLLASGDSDGVLKLWDVPAEWCKKAR